MSAFILAHPWLFSFTAILVSYLWAKGARTICRTYLMRNMFKRVIFFDSGLHPMTDAHAKDCNVCGREKTN